MKTRIQLLLIFMCLALLVFCNRFFPPCIAAPDSYYYPSGYNPLGSTSYLSGSLADLQSNNEVYMTYQSYPSAFSAVTNTRAFIGYRSNSGTYLLNSTKERTWNGSAWDASEAELPTSESPVRSVRAAYSTLLKHYDYKIAVALSDDGTLDAYVYNGTSWSATSDLADLWTTAPTGAQRPYDIAFETTSGNAILVYAWFDDGTSDLAYRIWFANNQTWSSQTLLDDPTQASEADYSFILLDNDKTSESSYIALIALDITNSNSLVGIWNGFSWVSLTDLSTSVSIIFEEDIGVVWAYDGSVMVVSGEGADEVIRWNRWTKTGGWGTSSTFDMDTGQTLTTNWIRIKADPATDDLMLIMVDSGSDLHSAYWNGATWSITSNIDTPVDTNARRPADFDWEPTGSKGLLVRGTTGGQITWRTWTTDTGWSTDTSPTMGTYTHLWVQLKRNPRNVAGDIKILGAVLESTSNDLGAIKWDGTTFTVIGTSTFSTDTTVNTYEAFDIELQNSGDAEQFASEVEFTGTSDTEDWTMIIWTVDSAWTTSTVTTTIQLYNYQQAQYPTSGDGYINFNSSGTPNTDEQRNQSITTNPTHFRDSLGNWKIRIRGVKATSSPFNFNADLVEFQTSLADIWPPTWSNAGTNSTIAGQPTQFHAEWADNKGLSGFIFGTNNTGTWTNDTWTSMSGTNNWSNVTKTLNNVGGTIVQWRIWANDTSNNWNDAGVLSLTTQQLPMASFTYIPSTPYTGETITFDGSASYDLDGTIVSYFWSFGDGTNATGMAVTHEYADNDIFAVTLRVTDNDGLTDTDEKSIGVLNSPPVASFTESATTAPTGTPIYFNASASYDPDGSIVSYFWTFGDGTNATGVTVNHSYADNGVYTVTLTVTDDDGATAAANATKTVLNRAPVASFTESATTVYRGDAISFNASASYDPDGSILSYFWAFGDGTNATGTAVNHTYANIGTYIVTLNVTDDDGAIGTASAAKYVLNSPPVASFTESATTVYTDEPIYFNASQSYDVDGSIATYFWNFGDGANASGMTANHAYADDGVYTVTLTITDNDGATDIATATKTILNRPPVASFTESATTALTGEMITFNASTSYDPDGSITNFSWNFGDGATAMGVLVDHAYADDGVYNVTLTVTDNDGSTSTANATKTILNRAPVASFTESATNVLTGEPIHFNASASYDQDGSIVAYFWDFGDGTNGTGMAIAHSYSDDGLYIVALTVTDNDGATAVSTTTKTVLNRPPVASFTESAATVLTGEVISFNASSSYDSDGSISSFSWDFGDGTNITGIIVQHAYADNGVYAVTLTITDDDGATNSTSAIKTVLNRSPVAIFTESAENVIVWQVIYFNASQSYDVDGLIVDYFWDFGDGTNTTGILVEHSYVDNGVYTVTLAVTDDDGATATSSANKTVLNRAPVASFSESATTVYTGEIILFNASDSYDTDGVIVSYLWDFGDSTNATGVTASHTYTDEGSYIVTLTVTDDDGDTATANATKTVLNRPPVASFTLSPDSPLKEETVSFDASDSHDPDGSVVSYQWSFGDGNVTTVTSPTITHVYTAYGNYAISLTVTDDDGFTDTTVHSVAIRDYPTAAFTYSPSLPIAGETAAFNASSSSPNGGSITSYSWNFGDGTPIINTTDPTTTHAYSSFGNYTVILAVTDSEGLSDEVASVVRVRGYPAAAFAFTPSFPIEGETTTFDADASIPNGGSTISYQWNFGDEYTTNSTSPATTHIYSAIGNYTVTLTVTDSEGLSDSESKVVSVRGYPIATFTYTPASPFVGDTVTFNASLSTPNGGTVTSYSWNFGDGSQSINATTPITTHVYASAGNCMITLTLIDSEGLNDTEVQPIAALKAPVAVFTYSPSFPQVAELVTFNASGSYDPNGYIVGYRWNFGDGNVTATTATTIKHAYSSTGTYTVILNVTDNGGYTDTIAHMVALGTPEASFSYTPNYPIVEQPIVFNASSSYDPNGYIVSYVWNFGDGNVTTVANPIIIHAYSMDGNYTVALTVADNQGTTDTTSQVVSIGKAPIASFTFTPVAPYVGDTVSFNASGSIPSSGGIAYYLWNFGDGSPVQNNTTPTTTHVYAIAGTYTVRLTITDTMGLGNTATNPITVAQSPVANFTHLPTYPQAFDTVTFNASNSYDANGYIVTYVWNFDDSNVTTVTAPMITHVYGAAGNYTVVLIVADNAGYTHTTSRSLFVSMRPPVAAFTHAPDSPIAGQTVTLNASNSYDLDGAIVNYRWNFGDGNTTTVTNALIVHTYSTYGNYTIALTVTDDDNLTNTKTTTVRVKDYPTATFTHMPSIPDVGGTVTFDASSSTPNGGVIASYLWNFGDGSPQSNTTDPIVTHVYGTSGNYTVTLALTDTEGLSDTGTHAIYVAEQPTASFTFSPASPYVGDTVMFNASLSYDVDGYIVGYSWDFGDGTPLVNETGPLTTHIYAMGGAYSVMLTVTDNMGLRNTTTILVNIGEAPSALFTYSPGFPIASEIVTFDASGSYDVRRPIANYTWNFGDGNMTVVTANAINHAYAKEGTYSVSLTVTDIGGYADTTTQIVSVRDYPIADFAFAPSYPVKTQDVTFDATYSKPVGGTITSYLWDFGDGTPKLNMTSPILKRAFASVGSYNVTLTVADSEGLTSTVVKTLKVRDYPTPDFTWTPLFPIATQSVTFNASSSKANSGVITGYMWELGDGTIKTGATPIIAYSYSKANNYTVRLTITNSEGLSSSISKTITVLDAPPSASFTYSPAVPITGQSVTFNASASTDPDGAITDYTWNFGDGNITVVTSPIIYHIYSTAGNFTTTLTVRDDAGLEATYSRNVKVVTYPTASFMWSPSVPRSTESVIFDASTSTANSASIIGYTWNFGDDNTTTVTVATIAHQYGIKGNYTVTLTVTNTDGLSNSKSLAITLVGTPPSANFIWQPLMPQPGETVTFDASSSAAKGGIIMTYIWDFGDGTPPILVIYRTDVTHKFAAIGEYTVTLNVTDTEGLSDTKSKAVRVVAPPTANFTWTPQTPKTYETTVFDASTSSPNGGTITIYRWDFGDGNVTTVFDATVVHVYTASGNYVATLSVTDSEGLSDSTSKSINVSSATSPKADFSYLPSSPYVFETIEFDASASIPGTGIISSYVWDFGDGEIATVAMPFIAHAYDMSGNFSVVLTVENTAGLSNTKSKLVTVLGIGGPIANFTWFPAVPPPNKTVTFDASSSTLGWNGTGHPLIESWLWDFGDGNVTVVNGPIIIHEYNTPGNFTVTLTITDINGSTSNLTRAVKVTSLLGDLNGDGKVDIKDVAIVAKAYGSDPGDPNWNPIADLNGDGKVDIKDVAIVAKQYGKTLSYSAFSVFLTGLPSSLFQLSVLAVTSLLALAFAWAGETFSMRKKRLLSISFSKNTCFFWFRLS